MTGELERPCIVKKVRRDPVDGVYPVDYPVNDPILLITYRGMFLEILNSDATFWRGFLNSWATLAAVSPRAAIF